MEKHVVTCFLMNNSKILLLKRSQLVGSYRNFWAGISGYIEEGDESPYQRALIEIEEEVGVDKAHLDLLAEGSTVKIRDGPWIVHPFLFRVGDVKIVLDWEHIDYKWIELKDLSKFETVPQLEDSLRSVFSASRAD